MLKRGLAYRAKGAGLVVPERPDRARQRAGAGREHLRALRRGGLQARPGAVVLPHHRTTPTSCCRLRRPRLAGARQDDAAQLDRPLRGRAADASRLETGDDAGGLHHPARTRVWGATFMVLAPEHPLVPRAHHARAPGGGRRLYRAGAARRPRSSAVDRRDATKTGVFTGAYAINPVNDERIPVWIADYVLMGYGTGAIMAVPGARSARLRVRPEVRPADPRRHPAGRRDAARSRDDDRGVCTDRA